MILVEHGYLGFSGARQRSKPELKDLEESLLEYEKRLAQGKADGHSEAEVNE
jgi:hypothetical protein